MAASVVDAKAVLITGGPGSAKSELAAHVNRHHNNLVRRVVGVETIAHPSDGALLALVRIYFIDEYPMRPQI